MEYFCQPKVLILLFKTKYFEVTDTHPNRQTLQLIDFEDCHENVIKKIMEKTGEKHKKFIKKS